jgi:hypothetical protein
LIKRQMQIAPPLRGETLLSGPVAGAEEKPYDRDCDGEPNNETSLVEGE